MNPEIQERVYNEIKSLDCDGEYNIDDFTKLTYTEMVLKETMRLFPAAPFVFRMTTKQTQLKNGTLLPGTPCIIPIYKFHRSAHIWGDDCDQFDPERFSAERSPNVDMFYFMPFSFGARNCIGYKFAMILMKIVLCHLISNFRFFTDMKFTELEFSYVLILKLLSKYEITAKRR